MKRKWENLIGSDKVEGPAVYRANDRKIGSIERVIIYPMLCLVLVGSWDWAAITIRCHGNR